MIQEREFAQGSVKNVRSWMVNAVIVTHSYSGLFLV
jgi:hypothetical protein